MSAQATVTASLQGFVSLTDGVASDWSGEIRDAVNGTANGTYTSNTLKDDAIEVYYDSGLRGDVGILSRTFLFFDNIDTATGGGTITTASLSVLGYLAGDIDVIPISASAWGGDGSTTTLSNGDYDSLYKSGTSYQQYGDEIVGWNTSGYNVFTLNSTAIADMNSDGYLNVALVDFTYDFQYTNPGLGTIITSGIEFLDASFPIKLTITYDPTGYGNTVNGVTSANIGAINGVLTANIFKVNGV